MDLESYKRKIENMSNEELVKECRIKTSELQATRGPSMFGLIGGITRATAGAVTRKKLGLVLDEMRSRGLDK